MTLLQQRPLRRNQRRAILVVVGLLGLLITTWVSGALFESDREKLEQRFQLAARAHAEAVSAQVRQPLDHLATLQRLFASIEHVDWTAFKKFAEPMLSQPGVRSYSWLPRIEAADRSDFESRGKALWGKHFAMEERDAKGERIPAADRERYFPLLYSTPEEIGQKNVGLDIYATPSRRQQIDHAISTNLPTASEIGPLAVDVEFADAVLLMAPVYRKGVVPATPHERLAMASGVAVAVVSVGKLFAAANGNLAETGLNVRLFDLKQAPERKLLAAWNSRLTTSSTWPANEKPLIHAETVNLAGHIWALQVEATGEWLEINRSRGLRFVIPFGILATTLLLFYLRALLRRSELADSLEATQGQDSEQRKVAEAWANKLSLAVEQNPAVIFIHDFDGRIEYVNSTFVETTGYSREEAIGQNVRMLRPTTAVESDYRELWENLVAGQTWRGEFQSRRKDGTLYWDRALISPIKDRDGATTCFVTIRENITKLHEITKRLLESESRFRGAISVLVEGLVILSPDGTFIFANRAAEEFLGCAEGKLQGLSPQALNLQQLREDGSILPLSEYPSTITLRDGCEIRNYVLGHRYLDGSVRWLQVNASPLQIDEERAGGVVMTLSDISERRRAEEQLRLAFAAVRHSGEGILVTDEDQHIISVNPAFEAVTGYSAEEVAGKTPAFFSSGRHDEGFFASMRETLESTGYWQGEVWNRRKNGEIYPEWLGVSVVRDDENRPKYFVYIFSDMTERNEAQQRIEFLAHHDPLTGLPNRLLLRDRLEQAQAQAHRMQSRVGLMYLDLDRFKTINDSLGHPVGDALLKEVVDRLKHCVRESDTVSRQGGDEFIILLNDVRDGDAISRVADKIHQRMADPFLLGKHSLITSFSIGIALYPDDGVDFDSLLQKADTAMYHAKAAGRNSHRFFTEQMNLQVVEHLTLETQLRSALENKEFVLHYQPQMDLHDGKIVGAEALIRWNSPENGLVSPARFIPVAEDSGLIVPIGAWVLYEACRQARAWQDAGLTPFVVAVNLSAIQFRRLDLVNTVINALVLSDLDSQWLELELTESILIQDAEATLDTVRRLKALGIKLSVDDFGTGYSSLTYLKRFAVDKLKIDQSFVRDLVSDPDDAAIVRAIIQMARSLKLKTIAEGVETEELANLLRIFHCDEIQGYWLARPMLADDLEAFVREHQAR